MNLFQRNLHHRDSMPLAKSDFFRFVISHYPNEWRNIIIKELE